MTTSRADMAALYISERDRLQRRIRRIVGCNATAADLLHDLFVKLSSRSGCTGDPRAFLTTSARNAAIDHLRHERVKAEYAAGIIEEQYACGPAQPSQILEARDGLRHVDDVIRRLPEKTRHIFLLNRIHGRSFSEISKVMGLSSSAVEKHMSTAMKAIRAGIEDF